jgi:uroporphyrinogen decarboxylase
MDTAADPTIAASLVPQGVAIQGNLDPLAVVAGGEVMASEARSILEAMRGRPFIFNLGHGIVPPTPPEHVAALMEIVRAA